MRAFPHGKNVVSFYYNIYFNINQKPIGLTPGRRFKSPLSLLFLLLQSLLRNMIFTYKFEALDLKTSLSRQFIRWPIFNIGQNEPSVYQGACGLKKCFFISESSSVLINKSCPKSLSKFFICVWSRYTPPAAHPISCASPFNRSADLFFLALQTPFGRPTFNISDRRMGLKRSGGWSVAKIGSAGSKTARLQPTRSAVGLD